MEKKLKNKTGIEFVMIEMSTNSLILKNDYTISGWFWRNIYGSSHIRIDQGMGKEGYYKFMYLLVSIHCRNPECDTFEKVELDDVMMRIIEDSPLKDIQTQRFIYVPTKTFTITSGIYKNRLGIETDVKIEVYLKRRNLTKLVGLDFWTSRWFWGGITGLSRADARKALHGLVSNLSEFDDMDRVIKMAMNITRNNPIEISRPPSTNVTPLTSPQEQPIISQSVPEQLTRQGNNLVGNLKTNVSSSMRNVWGRQQFPSIN